MILVVLIPAILAKLPCMKEDNLVSSLVYN